MALDRAVHDMIFQIGDAGDRTGHLDALVERGNPPRIGAAAAAAGDTEARFVHLGPRFEVIQCANAIPCLRSGGTVPARVPPPHSFAIGAVVDALDFAQLDRVQHQADIAVTREPNAVPLIIDFVAVADAIAFYYRVAAPVQDRGGGVREVFRHIEVSCDVEAGHRLEMQILDGKFRLVVGGSDGRL